MSLDIVYYTCTNDFPVSLKIKWEKINPTLIDILPHIASASTYISEVLNLCPDKMFGYTWKKVLNNDEVLSQCDKRIILKILEKVKRLRWKIY